MSRINELYISASHVQRIANAMTVLAASGREGANGFTGVHANGLAMRMALFDISVAKQFSNGVELYEHFSFGEALTKYWVRRARGNMNAYTIRKLVREFHSYLCERYDVFGYYCPLAIDTHKRLRAVFPFVPAHVIDRVLAYHTKNVAYHYNIAMGFNRYGLDMRPVSAIEVVHMERAHAEYMRIFAMFDDEKKERVAKAIDDMRKVAY